MPSSHNQTITDDDLSGFIKALKDYKHTGYKQSISIVNILKSADLEAHQYKEILPEAWLKFLDKVDSENDEEKQIKEEVQDMLKGLNKKYKEIKSKSPEKSKAASPQKEQEDKGEEHSNSHANADTEPKEATGVSNIVKDFTVKTFKDGLLLDCDPKAKSELDVLARRKANEIEQAVEAEAQGSDEAFRLEARNVSNFLLTVNNDSLRDGLLTGKIDPQEFVHNKEKFLNDAAKERIEENEKRVEMDINADYDRKMVPESDLYKCEKCGSKRINKTEKQMEASDKESTTVLFCADCENVQLIHG